MSCKRRPCRRDSLGQHFIVGYSSFAEVAVLAEKGLIAGIYITKHNVGAPTAETSESRNLGASGQTARRRLAAVDCCCRSGGRYRVAFVAALDQIAGALDPGGTSADVRAEKAEAFGRIHGQELAALGVNLNLAPVLDLRPKSRRNRFDFNTLIGYRAISDDPAIVAEIAGPYVRGLEASGVGAAVKHFPGLGRVRADTHHFSAGSGYAHGGTGSIRLASFPGRARGLEAQLMIGHVTLTAVDPDRAASHSRLVVDGIVRKKWNYQGVVMTDDLVMGAIYQHNVCTAVVEALNAGVDLLLVAFDGAQFYRIFACAKAASSEGRLDAAMLGDSEARLKGAFAVSASGELSSAHVALHDR